MGNAKDNNNAASTDNMARFGELMKKTYHELGDALSDVWTEDGSCALEVFAVNKALMNFEDRLAEFGIGVG